MRRFEDLPVSTMTLVYPLEGVVDIGMAFNLLPITLLALTAKTRQSKKYKPEHCAVPGAILSLRYRGLTRGLIRSSSSKYFKNSVTLDISTERKNVNIKLSPETIHMCGACSEENGNEAVKLLLENLQSIQNMLDWIQHNQEEACAVIRWIKTFSKGQSVTRNVSTMFSAQPLIELEEETIDHEIVTPCNWSVCPGNKQLAYYLLNYALDFVYHSDYCEKLDWVLQYSKIMTDNMRAGPVNKAMVNRNYWLGFHVNRYMLSVAMDGYDGFFASYDNAMDFHVRVELPYVPVKSEWNIMRKRNKARHTFLIYQSGKVTQSGPDGQEMAQAYYRFMNGIYAHLNWIRQTEALFQTAPQSLPTTPYIGNIEAKYLNEHLKYQYQNLKYCANRTPATPFTLADFGFGPKTTPRAVVKV
jgi:hypothetical protein